MHRLCTPVEIVALIPYWPLSHKCQNPPCYQMQCRTGGQKGAGTLIFKASPQRCVRQTAHQGVLSDDPKLPWRSRTSMLLRTLRNVNAIPPPTIISFTLSNILSINWILSATFALQNNASVKRLATQHPLILY